jgi:hypothetical protein
VKSGFDRIGHTVTVEAAHRQCLDKKPYASKNKARDAAGRNKRIRPDSPVQRPYRVLAGIATWMMLFGGGRCGKTFLIIRAIVLRALKAPGSRHLSCASASSTIKASIILDTFPKVMRLCFPDVHYDLNKTTGTRRCPAARDLVRRPGRQGAHGEDPRPRVRDDLRQRGVAVAVGRRAAAAHAPGAEGHAGAPGREPEPLKLRFLFDCNPPSKAHWAFKVFKQKLDPETKEPLKPTPDNYASLPDEPADNADNLSPEYLETLKACPAHEAPLRARRVRRGHAQRAVRRGVIDLARRPTATRCPTSCAWWCPSTRPAPATTRRTRTTTRSASRSTRWARTAAPTCSRT